MADKTIVNYDELQQIRKRFETEAEEYAELNSRTRQMVDALESEWIGQGAEKFFNEFENELFPAMKRLHHALLFTSDTLQDVMKIFDEAENESAGLFKDGSLENADFGAGAFESIIGRIRPDLGAPGDLRDIDFGLDDFEVGDGGGSNPPGETPPAGDTPPGGGTSGSGSGGASQSETSSTEPTSSGGGGGSGSGSQGLQGELQMGTGSSRQGGTGQGSTGGGGSQAPMQDHVYQSSSSGSGGGSSSSPSSSSSSSSGGESEGSGIGGMVGTAGALGGAGAAAGAAKKALKGDDDEDE